MPWYNSFSQRFCHFIMKCQGGQLLFLSGNAPSAEAGETKLRETLNNGSAAKKFEDMIIAQGADPEKARVLCNKNANIWSVLQKARFITPVKSQKTGWVFQVSLKHLKSWVLIFIQSYKLIFFY